MGKVAQALGMKLDLGSPPMDGTGKTPRNSGDAAPGLKLAADDSAPDSTADGSDSDSESSQPAEVHAMRLFSKATTDEARVSALKGFLAACGCSMDGGDDSY